MNSTFEFLLNPNLLTEQLRDLSENEALQHLKSLLALLQSERGKDHSHPPLLHLIEGGHDPEVQALTEVTASCDQDNNGNIASNPFISRKLRTLQILCLQTACKLDWDLDLFHTHVSVGLQGQLMECLAFTDPDAAQIIVDLSSAAAQRKVPHLAPIGLFILGTFCRWIVNASTAIQVPLPLTTKVTIYSSLPNSTSLPTVGNNEHGSQVRSNSYTA